MRSRNTNILQTVILITGLVYIILGITLYASPLTIIKAFAGNSAETITSGMAGNTAGNISENLSENWLDLVQDNEIIGPLYFMLKCLAAVLFTTGLSQVMPLFDPLKYRSLIYFQGILFPFMSAVLLIKQSVSALIRQKEAEAIAKSAMEVQFSHTIIIMLAVIFTVIFILTVAGLAVTRKEAREGRE